ncbi:hypothetical protein SK128_020552 [Halocaridina rubra]|uniref:Methyltransferase domain-containing protein n=1 Tax=Halocaridina rubra TaxID=373956 RepID=A0AAN8XDE6_HALRR
MSEFLAGATKRVKPPFFFKDLATFVNYAENPRVICPQLRYMGGRRRPTGERDGDKAVCFNPVYNISPNDCIVYSFGISTDWSFDDAMAGLGCQVYSFDHTIGLPSHDRSDRVHFYNIGLAHRDVTQTGQNANYTLMSLTHIMDMLGHLNKTIDYVKIDIEASEIYILQQLAEESVRLLQIKQLGIEMHPMENLHEFVYDLFVLLEYLGFTTFDARRTAVEELWYTVEQYPNLVLSKCYEMAWAQVETIYW